MIKRFYRMNMSTEHLELLGTIRNLQLIADIESQLLKHIVCMFQNSGRRLGQ